MADKLIIIDANCVGHIIANKLHKGTSIPLASDDADVYGRLAAHWISNAGWLPALANEQVKVVWAVDSKPYWRVDYEPEYKAHRKKYKTEAEEQEQKMIRGFVNNWTQLLIEECGAIAIPRYEADDIASAIIRLWHWNDTGRIDHVFISSVDTDWLAMSSEKVTWLNCAYHMPRVRGLNESYEWLMSKWKKQSKKRQRWWEIPDYQNFSPTDIWQWKSVVGDKADGLKPGSDIRLIDLFNPHENWDLAKNKTHVASIFNSIVNAPYTDTRQSNTYRQAFYRLNAPEPLQVLALEGQYAAA